MSEFTFDFDSVQRIVASALGEPGRRTFYVQVQSGVETLSMLAEKQQVASLAEAVNNLLDDLAEQNPLLTTSDDMLIANMSLQEPVEPEFRIAQMGLGYDNERDMVILIIQGLTGSEDADDDDDTLMVRIAATRPQMRAMSVYANRVVAAGRPICGNCSRPIDPEGHFCPERNGHGPVYA